MNQYDVYTVKSYQDFSKPRPCVLVETKSANVSSAVQVTPFTSVDNQANSFRIKVEPSTQNGLTAVSYLMVERTGSVPTEDLGEKIGHLESQYTILLREKLGILFSEEA